MWFIGTTGRDRRGWGVERRKIQSELTRYKVSALVYLLNWMAMIQCRLAEMHENAGWEVGVGLLITFFLCEEMWWSVWGIFS